MQKEHNYIKKVVELIKEKAFELENNPGLYDLFIRHDDWCNIYQNKYCNCNPDVEIKRKLINKGTNAI